MPCIHCLKHLNNDDENQINGSCYKCMNLENIFRVLFIIIGSFKSYISYKNIIKSYFLYSPDSQEIELVFDNGQIIIDINLLLGEFNKIYTLKNKIPLDEAELSDWDFVSAQAYIYPEKEDVPSLLILEMKNGDQNYHIPLRMDEDGIRF